MWAPIRTRPDLRAYALGGRPFSTYGTGDAADWNPCGPGPLVVVKATVLARSPARLPPWPGAGRGGSGLSLEFLDGYQVVLRGLKFPWGRAAPRRDSAGDGKPSFRGIRLRSEDPLNIRTGSSRAKRGTRLSGRIRETNRHGGELAELAKEQRASTAGGNSKLPPGPMARAPVKSCERYRPSHQGSISPNAYFGTSNPGGQTPVRGLERVKVHGG